MKPPTPRELLAQADEQRRIARGADRVMRDYRLGRAAVVHRKTGLFGWVKDRSKAPDESVFETLPSGVHTAVYLALRIVKRDAEAAADELEARVTTEVPR